MRRLLLPVVAALAAVGVIVAIVIGHGHASTSSSQKMRQTAPAFLTSVLKLLVTDKYADAWQTLNPAHQAVAPKSVYVACEMESPIRTQLVSLKVLAVGHERVRLVPNGPRLPSVAVTFGAILRNGKAKSPAVLHLHAVANGSWTWILPPARYAFYKSGGCASAPPTHP